MGETLESQIGVAKVLGLTVEKWEVDDEMDEGKVSFYDQTFTEKCEVKVDEGRLSCYDQTFMEKCEAKVEIKIEHLEELTASLSKDAHEGVESSRESASTTSSIHDALAASCDVSTNRSVSVTFLREMHITGRPRAIRGQRYPLPCFAWL